MMGQSKKKEIYRICTPASWKPEDEALNIIDIFNASTIAYKRYIFTIDDSATSVDNAIRYLNGGTRLYETIDGAVVESDWARGTSIKPTAGSTNRYAIVSGSGLVQGGGVTMTKVTKWVHLGDTVTIIVPAYNNYSPLVTAAEGSLTEIQTNFKMTTTSAILDLPDTIRYLGYSFDGKKAQAIVIRATEPPVSSNTAGGYANISCDIFVPDDSVNNYKTAIRFSSFASKIKPLSTYDRNNYI